MKSFQSHKGPWRSLRTLVQLHTNQPHSPSISIRKIWHVIVALLALLSCQNRYYNLKIVQQFSSSTNRIFVILQSCERTFNHSSNSCQPSHQFDMLHTFFSHNAHVVLQFSMPILRPIIVASSPWAYKSLFILYRYRYGVLFLKRKSIISS